MYIYIRIPAGIPLRISSFAIGSTGTGYVTVCLNTPRVESLQNTYDLRADWDTLRGRNEVRGAYGDVVAPSANNIFMARRVGKIYTGSRYTVVPDR